MRNESPHLLHHPTLPMLPAPLLLSHSPPGQLYLISLHTYTPPAVLKPLSATIKAGSPLLHPAFGNRPQRRSLHTDLHFPGSVVGYT
jgi:hypothetical protein